MGGVLAESTGEMIILLRPYGATAVALTPGWMRSEIMLELFGVTERRDGEGTALRHLGDAALRGTSGRCTRCGSGKGTLERPVSF